MDDAELDRRLAIADPSTPTPVTLESTIDDLVARPRAQRRGRWLRPVAVVGGAVVAAGGLAAATDLETYLMTVPPFSGLWNDTSRVVQGLPYTPATGPNAGSSCAIFLDLEGTTPGQFDAATAYWNDADPEAFAAAVDARWNADAPVPDGSTAESNFTEDDALREQILADLETVVPGIAWGSSPPGAPLQAGDPHLSAFSITCEGDLAWEDPSGE